MPLSMKLVSLMAITTALLVQPTSAFHPPETWWQCRKFSINGGFAGKSHGLGTDYYYVLYYAGDVTDNYWEPVDQSDSFVPYKSDFDTPDGAAEYMTDEGHCQPGEEFNFKVSPWDDIDNDVTDECCCQKIGSNECVPNPDELAAATTTSTSTSTSTSTTTTTTTTTEEPVQVKPDEDSVTVEMDANIDLETLGTEETEDLEGAVVDGLVVATDGLVKNDDVKSVDLTQATSDPGRTSRARRADYAPISAKIVFNPGAVDLTEVQTAVSAAIAKGEFKVEVEIDGVKFSANVAEAPAYPEIKQEEPSSSSSSSKSKKGKKSKSSSSSSSPAEKKDDGESSSSSKTSKKKSKSSSSSSAEKKDDGESSSSSKTGKGRKTKSSKFSSSPDSAEAKMGESPSSSSKSGKKSKKSKSPSPSSAEAEAAAMTATMAATQTSSFALAGVAAAVAIVGAAVVKARQSKVVAEEKQPLVETASLV